MIKAVIVDDEKNARLVLSELLKETFDSIEIVAEAKNVEEAVSVIEEYKPDLLFLDVIMPDGTGFDVLKKTNYKSMRIIFVTAHHEHAIKAIKFSAFDYILKPVNSNEVIETVKKTLEEQSAKNTSDKMDAAISNFNSAMPDMKKLVLKTSERIYLVNINEIIRLEADNNYTHVFLDSGENILVSKTMKIYDDILSSYGFMRVHQSHLINLNHIKHFENQDGGFITLTDGSSIPVSKNKKALLLEYFSSL